MANAPPAHQDLLTRLYAAARQDATNGVVDQTHKVRLRYWTHWSHFLTIYHQLDPFLQGLETKDQVTILCGFARWVREGHAGRGHQVRAGSVQAALCAIGQTFELDCKPNPLYQTHAYGKLQYWRPIKRVIDCYKAEDPAASPKLAVPVTITEAILQHHRHHTLTRQNAKQEAIADLINIAFYYLLRVGEYTRHTVKGRRTKPFRVCDITFRDKQGHLIPNTAPLSTLLTAVEATMRIPDQKNGVKGQCIHNDCTGTMNSPVKSLARRVHNILSNNGTETMHIFQYKDRSHSSWQSITARHINETLKDGADLIQLYNLGYTRDDVSSHSLRAGGAMAMHLNGASTLAIQKQGRWRSQTFQDYIHEQISAFAAGMSIKMSHAVPFRHIAGPTLQGKFVPAAA